MSTHTTAVVFQQPERLRLGRVSLTEPGPVDVVVEVHWSGISTGTERLLWSGRMPAFPGMGYPLVPGYEAVGTVVWAGGDASCAIGTAVFVPGARCYTDVRGLFGAAAARLVVPAERVVPIPDTLAEEGVLLALAATAHHALVADGVPRLPGLVVGHGVLGRLVARLVVALGAPPPVVWETNPARRVGAAGYAVIPPADDARTDYPVICDVSGAPDLLDTLIARLAPGGEVVLAGFYDHPLSFDFPPAFMREARLRVAAEWKSPDLSAVMALITTGRLSLDGLITHRHLAEEADEAYRTAFGDAACLKMILDWRSCQ